MFCTIATGIYSIMDEEDTTTDSASSVQEIQPEEESWEESTITTENLQEVEEIPRDTLEAEEEPVTELGRFIRDLARINAPFVDWSLDSTLRDNLRRLLNLAALDSGVQLAMLSKAVWTFRDNFRDSCPNTCRRVVSLTATPQLRTALVTLGADYQVVASVLDNISDVFDPDNREEQQQAGGEYVRLSDPYEILREMDCIVGLALATFIDEAFFQVRHIMGLTLLTYLIFFSHLELLQAEETVRLLQSLSNVWSIVNGVVNRFRIKLQDLDIQDNVIKELAMGSAVAYVGVHFTLIGLPIVSFIIALTSCLFYLPPPQTTPGVLIATAAAFPNVTVARGAPKLLGVIVGILASCILNGYDIYMSLFKASLQLIIYSLLQLTE